MPLSQNDKCTCGHKRGYHARKLVKNSVTKCNKCECLKFSQKLEIIEKSGVMLETGKSTSGISRSRIRKRDRYAGE